MTAKGSEFHKCSACPKLVDVHEAYSLLLPSEKARKIKQNVGIDFFCSLECIKKFINSLENEGQGKVWGIRGGKSHERNR